MALSLQEIRAKLLQQQADKDRRAAGGGFTGDNAIYPFWNNPDNSTAVMRFLPDGNDSNDFFWKERLLIKLPFKGVKGQSDSKPCEVQVPCMDMWQKDSCPITAEIRPWWKDPSLENMARTYYKKKSYFFQGFVPENPNPDDNTPENPIRRFIVNPSVFERVKSILLVQDVEDSPTDYDRGLDFYLVKTSKGKYANYDSSQWMKPGTMSLKTRSLNEAERAAIEKFGLWDLSSFLPKMPDKAHLDAIMEMFTASVNEELYDADRWGQFYRPNGLRLDTDTAPPGAFPKGNTESKPYQASSAVPSTSSILNKFAKKDTVEETAPWEEQSSTSVTPSTDAKPSLSTPEDVIAAIRNRHKK